MWCSAATLTRTTHGTGPLRLRSARSVGSSISPTIAVGAEPGEPLAHRRGPARPEPTSTHLVPVRRLDGHGGVVVDALRQPAHDLAQCVLRDDAELGGYVEQLALSGGRTGLQPLLLEAGRDAGQDRTVDPGQQQHPVGERPVGRDLAEVEAAQLRGGRGVVLEARGVAQPVVGRLECGLPEAVERLTLAEEGAAGQARVPADQGGERPGRPRAAACAAARVAPSRMPTAATVGAPRSRRYWRAASMLACQAGTRSGSSCSPAESPVPS